MDTLYTQFTSPIGELLVIADADAVIRVAFEREGFDDVLAQYPQARHGESPILTQAVDELTEYFAGTRKEFTVPVTHEASSEFRQQVFAALTQIPFGETVSYSELATRAGNPDAVRAAGTACGANPVPLLVPCHRVVRSDGSTGSYLGGEEVKTWLLTHEGGSVKHP